MNRKLLFLTFAVILISMNSFSQDLELVNLKTLQASTAGGGGTSIYYFLKGFNQKSLKDWEKIKSEILKVFADNTNVNQLTIYFMNKPVYNFDSYTKNYFKHPVPDTKDLYASTIGNKKNTDSETRCSETIVAFSVFEPAVGYLSNICYPVK